jgi:hypothetical protein
MEVSGYRRFTPGDRAPVPMEVETWRGEGVGAGLDDFGDEEIEPRTIQPVALLPYTTINVFGFRISVLRSHSFCFIHVADDL